MKKMKRWRSRKGGEEFQRILQSILNIICVEYGLGPGCSCKVDLLFLLVSIVKMFVERCAEKDSILVIRRAQKRRVLWKWRFENNTTAARQSSTTKCVYVCMLHERVLVASLQCIPPSIKMSNLFLCSMFNTILIFMFDVHYEALLRISTHVYHLSANPMRTLRISIISVQRWGSTYLNP